MNPNARQSSKMMFFFHEGSYHWVHSALVFFNLFIAVLIASDQFLPPTVQTLNQCMIVLRYLFLIELLFRMILMKGEFFKKSQNIFMTIILASSFFMDAPSLTVLLTFVALKSFRTIHFIPKTKQMIDAFIRTLPGVLNVLLMIVIAFVVFATLATHLFGAYVPRLWGNFMASFLSLQQVMLGDDWGNNLRATMAFYPHAWIFLTVFLFLVSMILLNLFVGVIVDAMQNVEEPSDDVVDSSKQADDLEHIKQEVREIKKILKKHISSGENLNQR